MYIAQACLSREGIKMKVQRKQVKLHSETVKLAFTEKKEHTELIWNAEECLGDINYN